LEPVLEYLWEWEELEDVQTWCHRRWENGGGVVEGQRTKAVGCFLLLIPSSPFTLPGWMDARQLLALQDTAPKSLLTAADVAQRKVAAYNGIPRRSKHERERDAAAKKQAEEDEFAAVAYEEYVAAFGVEEEGKSGRNSGKGFVRAGGGGYDPLRDRQASGSVQRVTVVPPVAPRAVVGRQSAASLMSAAADVRLVSASVLVGC
jgi:hypothetical protein